jgi:archaeosine synthase alpha-subunit
MRIAGRLEGLAVTGAGSIGSLSLELPSLLGPAGAVASGPILINPAGAAPGRRRLRLEQASASLDLDFAVPTPEISGEAGIAEPIGEGTWLLHLPLAPAEWERVRLAAPELLLLGNARALFDHGRSFVEALGEIRRRLGAAPLLWAPRVAVPERLALLVYLGVDLLDTTEGLWRGAEGQPPDETLGPMPRARDAPSSPVPTDHILAAYASEMARVRQAIVDGRLRELVEVRLGSEPAQAELLRHADRMLTDLLEERTPVISDRMGRYVYRESQRRPEVRRYRQRFAERYLPPPSKRVLLLLPCSQTKPYRYSRSHRRFARALEGLSGLPWLHSVSVTSPLGVVPRELEDLPPARHYDIPVTGEWDEEERGYVRAGLQHLLSSGAYRSVIAHLDPKEYSFLSDTFPAGLELTWTLLDHRSTSPEALTALRTAVEAALPSGSPPGGPLAVVREELEALAGVQFGIAAAKALFQPPVRLHGRPWFQRLTEVSGKYLATWQESRGLFQLTMEGARRLDVAGTPGVEYEPKLELLGDLFTPGVRAADRGIRAGDAVILRREGVLAAVGEAALPGALMTELPRGLAVQVRHRSPVALEVRGRAAATEP